MIEARQYDSLDARGADRLLETKSLGHGTHGSADLNRDRIIVTGPVGSPTGLCAWRPAAYVHEFRTNGSLSRLFSARALVEGAIREGVMSKHFIRTAIFRTDLENSRMIDFLESQGAISLDDKPSRWFKLEF